MIFTFRTIRIGPAGPALPRSRPILPLRVYGRNYSFQSVPVLIDTGADEVLLPEYLIPLLGFTPGSGRTKSLTTVGGRAVFRYFDLELELFSAANNRVRWATTIGFGPVAPRIGLFGIAGGLEFFHLSMSVADQWFALSPHPLIQPVPPTAYPHSPFAIP